jgi:DNA-binding beta-propeller fold protein YncE
MRSVLLPGRPIRAGVMFLALFSGAASSAFAQKVLLYVANFNSNSETEFAVPNPATGALVPFAPKTTNRNPYEIAVSPNGKYLYVGENGAIEVFTIDLNGNASPPPAATITGNVAGMTIDPAGKFLFVSNSSTPLVETYAIDSATGNISLVATYPIASAGSTPPVLRGVEVDASNHLFLAVTNNGAAIPAGYVSVFNVAGNGSISPITPISNFSTGSTLGPNRLALNAGKTLLFATNQFGPSVASLSVTGTGALILADTKPAGSQPIGIAVDPVANVVVVADNASSDVLVYTFASGGALSPASTPTYAVGSQPLGVTIDPTGTNVYVSNSADNTVTRYSINSSGVLSSPFTAPTGGLSPQFLLARFPPSAATVPTLSTPALAALGMLLAGLSGLLYRKAVRQS